MNEIFVEQLKKRARSLLEKGRGNDWEHTRRAVAYGRQLLGTEPGEADIVVPALYLHDIGWSRVDYSDFKNAPPAQKKDAKSVGLHMMHGAEMAAEILADLGYDPEKSRVIADIVAVHDDTEKIFAMGNPSAVLVAEADRLDRYGPDSLERYRQMFGSGALTGQGLEDARLLRRIGLKEWFRTPTAKALAEKLGRDSGWLV